MDNEKGTFLGSFVVDDKMYGHFIYTTEDDRVELHGEDNKPILIYDSHGTVALPGGMVLGYFSTGETMAIWKFTSKHPILEDSEHIEIHPENLLHFELKISEQYIKAIAVKQAA